MKKMLIVLMAILLITGCSNASKKDDVTTGKQNNKTAVTDKNKDEKIDKKEDALVDVLEINESDSKDEDSQEDDKENQTKNKDLLVKDKSKSPVKDNSKTDAPKKVVKVPDKASNSKKENTTPKKEVDKPKENKPAAKPVVTKKVETKNSAVAFENTDKNDGSLDKGKTSVSVKGVDGNREVKYEVTYTDGVETGRKVISDKVTVNPVNQITLVGTKEVAQDGAKKAVSYRDGNRHGLFAIEMEGTAHSYEGGIKYVPGNKFQGSFSQSEADELLRLINAYRAENGLHALNKPSNSNIQAFANMRNSMHGAGVGLAHIGDYDNNLGQWFSTPKAMLDGWIESPGHNANLLSHGATTAIVSAYKGPSGAYWTLGLNPEHTYSQEFNKGYEWNLDYILRTFK